MTQSLRRRRWTWIPWLLGLVAVVVLGVRTVQRRRATPTQVRVLTVERGRVRDLVSSASAGRVAAAREATLRAEIAGRVVRLHHRRGDRVAAGEPLVSYDMRDLAVRVRAAETSVALARAQATQAQASARLAARNADRAVMLTAQGVTARAESEGMEGQAEVARHAVGVTRAAELQGQANADVARDALRRAVVRAPFAGVVLTTHIEEGEVTAPGAPMLSLADTTSFHVDADIDEADLGRVREGMAAEVVLDAFPTERLPGRVTELAPSVTQDLRGNRSIALRVALDPDPRLRVGMSADVDVVVATREDAVHVPPNAVLGRGTDRAVWVVEGGVVRRRRIEVGVATWEAVEVLRGASAGDRVVVSLATEQLTDGARVTARPAQRAGAP
ncbi:MAG: efflux RND transporter periplasmic adaptor subunit [Deltaproteobacteria bacterium]|nr:efflux RND transporter periplasmic adaptor subunit [Deltaproteobacteria bacterium]